MSASAHPSSRELHEQHADERTRARTRERDEIKVRDRERARVLAHMLPEEELEDETGFAPGCML